MNPSSCVHAPDPSRPYTFLTDGPIRFSGGDGNGQLDYATGVFRQKFEDISAATFGPHLSFVRTYVSRVGAKESATLEDQARGLGTNWTFNFDVRLMDLANTGLPNLPPAGFVKIVLGPDGEPAYYALDQDGAAQDVFKPMNYGSVFSTSLVLENTGVATEYFKDGSFRKFNGSGSITQLCDRRGECLNYEYYGDGRLRRVRDARTSRAISLFYRTDHPKLIDHVDGPVGRVSFEYELGLGPEGDPLGPKNDARLKAAIASDRIERYGYKYREVGARDGVDYFDLQLDTMDVCDNPPGGTPTCDRVGTWTFDPATHKLASYLTPDSATVPYSYAYAGAATTVTDPRGIVTTMTLDMTSTLPAITKVEAGCSSCGGKRNFEWNGNRLLTAAIEADGNRTEYTYNDHGLPESATRILAKKKCSPSRNPVVVRV